MQATTDPTLVVYVPESVSSVGQQAFNGLLCVYFEHESKDDVSLAPNDSGAAHQVWNYNATDEDTPLDCFEFTLLDDGTYSIAVKTPERISVRLTIPSTYLGKPVTVISKAAFYECRRIKTVVIPNSIKRIEAEAFSQCTQLCEVDFGVVEFIGEKAFAYTALTEVTLPDTVILTEESHGIFTAAGRLKKADISRVQADLIPANLFASCYELIEVRLPDTASTIENGVFYQCNSLKNLTLPAQTKEIASNAFYNCTSLESVTVPTTLMKIEDNAFDKCSSLSLFDLPEGFTSLGNYAFQGCGLTEFYIPSSVSFIGYAPFNSAMKLEKIEVATDNKYYTSVNGVLYNKAVTNMYQYPCAKPDTYFELPETVTSVLSYAMNDADNLTEINLKNAETLQFHSLGGCDGLKSIELPDTLSFFERCALDGSAIERLVIPDGIDRLPAMTISIGDLKSSGLSLPKLKTVVIGKSLSDIEGLFHFTPSLESFEVSEENPYFKAIDGHLYDKSGTVLHRYAKAKAVGTVKIPEGVVVVASEAFFECNKLEKVVFSSTVKEIGKYAFSQCELLSEIELTNGIISIEKAAFYYVPLLKGVYIPESVEYVDYYAFYFAKYVLTNAKEIPSDWHLDTDVVITDYCVEHDEFYGFHEH